MSQIRPRRANPHDDGDLAVLALLRWWWLASGSPAESTTGSLAGVLNDRDALARYREQLAAWWRPRAGAHLAMIVEELPDALAPGQVPVAVGMGWLSVSEPLPWELFAAPRTALVHSLYVLPALRGRGVARLVLSELEAVARAAGIDELVASADASGSPVLYDAGFVADGRVGLARRSLTGVALPPVVDVPVGQLHHGYSGGYPSGHTGGQVSGHAAGYAAGRHGGQVGGQPGGYAGHQLDGHGGQPSGHAGGQPSGHAGYQVGHYAGGHPGGHVASNGGGLTGPGPRSGPGSGRAVAS